jgi:hypothetical protein
MAIFKNVFFKDVADAIDIDLLHQPSVQDWKWHSVCSSYFDSYILEVNKSLECAISI